MVLDIIFAAGLIAFGILTIYFAINESIGDNRLMLILLIGVGCILAGTWLLIDTLTIDLLLRKLFGIIMSGLGLFLLLGFPDILEYQREGMSRAGIFIGLFVLVIGVYFLLF